MNNNKLSETTDLNQLVGKLKTEDTNYARISRAIQIMYWIFIPLFIAISILHYTETYNALHLISGFFYVTSFLIFALFFGKYYKEYRLVDYSLPTVQMLRKAIWRYQPFQKRTVWVFLALALMDVGLTLSNLDDSSVWETQLFFLGAVLFGAVIGIILWYFKYKPLRDEAKNMLKDIEEE